MSSPQEKPLDVSSLNDRYDVLGEYTSLGQNRRYPGRRREDGRDVLITILRAAPDVAQGKAIAQFAADANLMATLNHPNVPQVLEGRWVGEDAFALVTERVQGMTLAEMLRGDRLEKPRIADILADVDGVLEWARNERLSHRGVSPDSIWIGRGTNRVFVTLAPTEAPKTNRPDPRDDARTIGGLAMAMLTAKPMTDAHDGSLASMRPDLPQRVVAATEKVAACTINDEMPDISAYLASLAMADAIKEGEVEVARVEAEFRAQMKAEREKWEAEQEACRVANEEQARKFADERAEYERRSEKEREQLIAARAEVDKRRTELQEARAELDAARAEYKERKAALDARAKQVEKQLAEVNKQKRALERRAAELELRNKELQEFAALAASGAAADITQRPTLELPPVVDDDIDLPGQDDVGVVREAVDAEEQVKAWTPIETEEPWAIPLETDEPVGAIQYEAAALPPEEPRKGRRWAVPAGIGVALLLAGGAIFAATRPDSDDVPPQRVATATGPTQLTTPPTPALRTDSAAGTIAPLGDSAVFAAIRDSIIAADEARRIRRQRAAAQAEEERRRQATAPRTITDSDGRVWLLDKPPGFGNQSSVTIPDTTRPRPDTGVLAPAMPAVPTLPKLRIDSLPKPRPDTLLKPRPDSIRPTCCSY